MMKESERNNGILSEFKISDLEIEIVGAYIGIKSLIMLMGLYYYDN
jgi:hypothetical protein